MLIWDIIKWQLKEAYQQREIVQGLPSEMRPDLLQLSNRLQVLPTIIRPEKTWVMNHQ